MLILYTFEDGKSRIQLRADENTVWLTQMEMTDLFATTKQNISLHLQNIFEDEELRKNSVVKESLTTAADGKAYATQQFFATVQNVLLYAVTRQTAAELITARANPADTHFGLRNFEQAYKPAVDAWAKYDNVGKNPILLEWGENQ